MYFVGEEFKSKKKHACGGDKWVITRVGADYKIRCCVCNREILINKDKLDKIYKQKIDSNIEK